MAEVKGIIQFKMPLALLLQLYITARLWQTFYIQTVTEKCRCILTKILEYEITEIHPTTLDPTFIFQRASYPESFLSIKPMCIFTRTHLLLFSGTYFHMNKTCLWCTTTQG